MEKLSLQFHATRPELLPLLVEFAKTRELVRTLLGGSPPSTIPWDGTLRALSNYQELPLTVAYTLVPQNPCTKPTNFDFVRHNPASVLIELGRFTPAGLTESWLATKTEDERILNKERLLKKNIYLITRTGASTENASTGARTPRPNLRFTPGAIAAYKDGVRILPVAGTSIIRLEE